MNYKTFWDKVFLKLLGLLLLMFNMVIIAKDDYIIIRKIDRESKIFMRFLA